MNDEMNLFAVGIFLPYGDLRFERPIGRKTGDDIPNLTAYDFDVSRKAPLILDFVHWFASCDCGFQDECLAGFGRRGTHQGDRGR